MEPHQPSHLNADDRSTASRRKFIRQAAAGTAGGTAIFSSPLARQAHAAQADETLKVALIGCGGRGTGAAVQALSTEGPVKLWAMADAFGDRLESSLSSMQRANPGRYDRDAGPSLASKIDVPPERRFIGLDGFQKAINSGIDVAIITAPPAFRPQHFEYAVNAGKHVFMEKPLATDAHGVRRILASAAAAKEKNLKIGVGLQRHHSPAYQSAIQQIQEGAIGKVSAMRCFWNTSAPAKTPVKREESISELQHQLRNWYFFHWLSGDHICEQHIHNLDVCNWVMNQYPIKAEGMGGRQVRVGKEYGDIYDHHAVLYTYSDGTTMHSYCRQIRGCKNLVAEYVEGTNGSAELGTNRCTLLRDQETIWQSPKDPKSPYQIENDVLFNAIRNDLPHNEAENGAMSTMTAILGRLATYSGKVISWDDALASDRRLTVDAMNWEDAAPLGPNEQGDYPIAMPGVTKVL